MIYLLGTRHYVQWKWDNPGPQLLAKFDRFAKYIADSVRKNTIAAIAEETNHETDKAKGTQSIAKFIAEGMKPPLYYLPCEPSSEERSALGILTADEITNNARLTDGALQQYRDAEILKYFPPREKYWIERLRRLPLRPVLFICGANHIQTFFPRLIDNGMPSQVISSDWCESDDNEYRPLPIEERPI